MMTMTNSNRSRFIIRMTDAARHATSIAGAGPLQINIQGLPQLASSGWGPPMGGRANITILWIVVQRIGLFLKGRGMTGPPDPRKAWISIGSVARLPGVPDPVGSPGGPCRARVLPRSRCETLIASSNFLQLRSSLRSRQPSWLHRPRSRQPLPLRRRSQPHALCHRLVACSATAALV